MKPWEQYKKQATQDASVGGKPWEQYQKNSAVASGLRKGLQGFTAGFSDEAAGAVEGAGKALGVDGLGGPMKDISLSKDGPTLDTDLLKDAYEAGRNRERAALKKDSEDNPVISTVAEIGGGLISPVNKIAKGASLAKQGAVMGGLAGAGYSEGESVGEVALDTVTGAGLGGLLGKGAEKAQGLISKGTQKLSEKISPPRQKADAVLIKEAADRLGIKVTPGMLDDTGFVERLEYTLAESPSLQGQSIARARKAVTDKLNQSASEVTKDASNLSPYQLGEKFKSGVSAKVGERLAPISSVFDEVAESTKAIGIGDKSKAAIIRNIESMDSYQLTGGSGKPGQYVEMIGRLKNADQVKQAMTLLNQDIKATQGAEKQVLIGIKEKLSTLEKNSIMRAAIQSAKEGGMRKSTGETIGREIVGDLKDARVNYRQLADDLGSVGENARLKMQKGPAAFLDSVESIPSERIQDKFFNVENNRQLMSLKDKFPEQFELLKQGKLKEIAESAQDFSQAGRGDTSSGKFLKAVRNLNSEAKEMLFGKDVAVIKDLEQVQKSLPRNFNPPGTANQLGWKDAIYQTAKDIPTYLLYRGASSNLARKVGEKLAQSPKTIKFLENNPAALGTFIRKVESGMAIEKALPMVADEKPSAQSPAKGYDKWANDGAEKLKSQGLPDSALNELMKTKKGKELLIRASDLKPGSKAFENLFAQIKQMKGGV